MKKVSVKSVHQTFYLEVVRPVECDLRERTKTKLGNW